MSRDIETNLDLPPPSRQNWIWWETTRSLVEGKLESTNTMVTLYHLTLSSLKSISQYLISLPKVKISANPPMSSNLCQKQSPLEKTSEQSGLLQFKPPPWNLPYVSPHQKPPPPDRSCRDINLVQPPPWFVPPPPPDLMLLTLDLTFLLQVPWVVPPWIVTIFSASNPWLVPLVIPDDILPLTSALLLSQNPCIVPPWH